MFLRHYLDVISTFFERYGRQTNVKTTLVAYENYALLTQDIIWHQFNVFVGHGCLMDVKTTL